MFFERIVAANTASRKADVKDHGFRVRPVVDVGALSLVEEFVRTTRITSRKFTFSK